MGKTEKFKKNVFLNNILWHGKNIHQQFELAVPFCGTQVINPFIFWAQLLGGSFLDNSMSLIFFNSKD